MMTAHGEQQKSKRAPPEKKLSVAVQVDEEITFSPEKNWLGQRKSSRLYVVLSPGNPARHHEKTWLGEEQNSVRNTILGCDNRRVLKNEYWCYREHCLACNTVGGELWRFSCIVHERNTASQLRHFSGHRRRSLKSARSQSRAGATVPARLHSRAGADVPDNNLCFKIPNSRRYLLSHGQLPPKGCGRSNAATTGEGRGMNVSITGATQQAIEKRTKYGSNGYASCGCLEKPD